MFPHGETVTRLRATTTSDPYSGESIAADWSNPSILEIAGCGIGSAGSIESVQVDRNPVTSDFDVVAPAGADIEAGDRLVIRGLICDVQGRPFAWRSPFSGWAPGMVVRAKIVEG